MHQRTNFVNNLKFVRSSKIIIQLKIELDAWQPIFDQRDGVVVRASASQSVDEGSFPKSGHTKRL